MKVGPPRPAVADRWEREGLRGEDLGPARGPRNSKVIQQMTAARTPAPLVCKEGVPEVESGAVARRSIRREILWHALLAAGRGLRSP